MILIGTTPFAATAVGGIPEVLGLLPHVLLGFAVAFFVGLLVPVGEDQPLSALAALLLTVGGATGLAVGLTALVGSNVPAGVAAAALGARAGAGDRRGRHAESRRAS